MQQRAETLDDALIRELLELRAERAHLHKTSSRAQVQEQCDGVGEEPGVVTLAAKVNRCSGDKLATTYACIAASSLTSHPPWHTSENYTCMHMTLNIKRHINFLIRHIIY